MPKADETAKTLTSSRGSGKRTLTSGRESATSSLTDMMLVTDAGMAVDRVGTVQMTALTAETDAGIVETTIGVAETGAGTDETGAGTVETDAGIVETVAETVEIWLGGNESFSNSASRPNYPPKFVH
jgi:hypothetical protein